MRYLFIGAAIALAAFLHTSHALTTAQQAPQPCLIQTHLATGRWGLLASLGLGVQGLQHACANSEKLIHGYAYHE